MIAKYLGNKPKGIVNRIVSGDLMGISKNPLPATRSCLLVQKIACGGLLATINQTFSPLFYDGRLRYARNSDISGCVRPVTSAAGQNQSEGMYI